jgi:hypothetical protein
MSDPTLGSDIHLTNYIFTHTSIGHELVIKRSNF